MDVRLNPPNLWRLSLAGVLVAVELVEGRPRYHLDNGVRFPAEVAHGRYTVTSYTTGGSVWVTPGTAEGLWSGFAPTVSSSG